MSLTSIIKNAEKIELSGEDVNRITGGNAVIMSYTKLGEYDNIDMVFKNKNCLILLYEIRQNFGHWVCLLRKSKLNEIEFFDPYGMCVDCELNYNNDYYRSEGPHLSVLLKKSGYKIVVNKKRFQQFKTDVNTCGRHSSLRCKMYNMSLKEYTNFLFNNDCKNPDFWVSCLTLFE